MFARPRATVRAREIALDLDSENFCSTMGISCSKEEDWSCQSTDVHQVSEVEIFFWKCPRFPSNTALISFHVYWPRLVTKCNVMSRFAMRRSPQRAESGHNSMIPTYHQNSNHRWWFIIFDFEHHPQHQHQQLNLSSRKHQLQHSLDHVNLFWLCLNTFRN